MHINMVRHIHVHNESRSGWLAHQLIRVSSGCSARRGLRPFEQIDDDGRTPEIAGAEACRRLGFCFLNH